MTPSERERRSEAAAEAAWQAWPAGAAEPGWFALQTAIVAALDAADEAVPTVSEEIVSEMVWLRREEQKRDLEQRAERAEKERDHWKGAYENYRDDAEESIAEAEAAARDFARAMEGVAKNLDRKTSAAPYEVRRLYTGDRDALRSALARHPSFSGEEGTEG